MAGFRRDQSRFDGLQVTHFADQDHVRILTERTAKSLGERTRIDVDLALRYKGFFVAMEKFDRVLDRDDMAVALLVNMVNDRGKRG